MDTAQQGNGRLGTYIGAFAVIRYLGVIVPCVQQFTQIRGDGVVIPCAGAPHGGGAEGENPHRRWSVTFCDRVPWRWAPGRSPAIAVHPDGPVLERGTPPIDIGMPDKGPSRLELPVIIAGPGGAPVGVAQAQDQLNRAQARPHRPQQMRERAHPPGRPWPCDFVISDSERLSKNQPIDLAWYGVLNRLEVFLVPTRYVGMWKLRAAERVKPVSTSFENLPLPLQGRGEPIDGDHPNLVTELRALQRRTHPDAEPLVALTLRATPRHGPMIVAPHVERATMRTPRLLPQGNRINCC